MNRDQRMFLFIGIFWTFYIVIMSWMHFIVPEANFFFSWLIVSGLVFYYFHYIFVWEPKHSAQMYKLYEKLGYKKGQIDVLDNLKRIKCHNCEYEWDSIKDDSVKCPRCKRKYQEKVQRLNKKENTSEKIMIKLAKISKQLEGKE